MQSLCQRSIYCGTNKFHDWRISRVVSMLGHAAAQQDTKFVESYQAYINLTSFSLLWAEYKTPTFFVEPRILEAIQHSGLPRDFDFTDLKLPFPALTFVFPKASRPITYNGHVIQYIGIANMTSSIDTPLGEVKASGKVNKLIVTTALYPSSFVGVGFRMDAMNEIVTMDTDSYIEASHDPRHGVSVDSNQAVLTHELLKLALGCVLTMEARPELVERERKLSVIRTGNNTRSLWTPNVIGRGYAIQGQSGASSGSHASPRTHWRRGHFRRQGVGHRATDCLCEHPQTAHDVYCQIAECACENYQATGFKEYKTIWIEPCLVSAPTVEI